MYSPQRAGDLIDWSLINAIKIGGALGECYPDLIAWASSGAVDALPHRQLVREVTTKVRTAFRATLAELIAARWANPQRNRVPQQDLDKSIEITCFPTIEILDGEEPHNRIGLSLSATFKRADGPTPFIVGDTLTLGAPDQPWDCTFKFRMIKPDADNRFPTEEFAGIPEPMGVEVQEGRQPVLLPDTIRLDAIQGLGSAPLPAAPFVPKVAILAICEAAGDRSNDDRHVVLVGTDALGTDWRVGCYSLVEFEKFKAGGALPPLLWSYPPDNMSTGDTPTDLTSDERGEIGATVADPGGLLSKWTSTFPAKKLESHVIRDIVQLQFFGDDAGPFGTSDAGPFLRLETCRAQPHAGMPGAPPPSGSFHVGSLLQYFTDPESGNVAAFRLMADMRLALNGHSIAGGHATAPDALDTRGRMILTRIATARRPNLWSADAAPVDQPLGLAVDNVFYGWTTAPAGSAKARQGKTFNRPDVARRTEPFTLYALAGCTGGSPTGSATIARIENGIVDRVPLLAVAKLPLPPGQSVTRSLGLRPDYPENTGVETALPKLILRFELDMTGYAPTLFDSKLARAIIPRFLPSAQAHRVILAQEQCCADVTAGVNVEQPVRWVLTARADPAVFGGDITGPVLDALGGLADQVRSGLRAVGGIQPLSLLPVISAVPSNGNALLWHLVGMIRENNPHVRTAHFSDGKADAPQLDTWFTSFEPRRSNDMWGPTGSLSAGPGKAQLAAFILETGAPIAVSFTVAAPDRVDITSNVPRFAKTMQPAAYDGIAANETGTRFSLTITTDAAGQNVTVGAMRMKLAETAHADPGFILLRNAPDDAKPALALPEELTFDVDAVLRIGLESAEPGGQDPDISQLAAAGAGRAASTGADRPLLFALPLPPSSPTPPAGAAAQPQAATAPSPPLMLTSRETVARDEDHAISLSIAKGLAYRSSTATLPLVRPQVLVIDPSPFRIATVDVPELAGLDADEDDEVAVWSRADDGMLAWRIPDEAQRVTVILPPQVIGEAMERYASTDPTKPRDIAPDEPADARLASATRVTIDPTYQDTRFREVDWNLRRLLGNARQRAPGGQLIDLRTEMIYGMVTQVARSDLHYSEIAGTIGNLVPPPGERVDALSSYLGRHITRTVKSLRAGASRLAVDTVWQGRPGDNPILDNGVNFRLRTFTASADALRWPFADGRPTDEVYTRYFGKPADDEGTPDGATLPGGVAWAFTNPGELLSVYRQPQSTGGRLTNLYLTALGGYGTQRALFDQNKSAIETETAGGRLHRYRLERIGRIAGLWNRAKHVVVYERTVVPAAQFYNSAAKTQDEHVGRPILRLVQEYVELIQPTRRFPEDGKSVASNGFLTGAEFKSIKIRVDSAWGSNVRDQGWKVPLWNRVFTQPVPAPAITNPDDPAFLYPKPQIHLILAGPDGELSVEIDEPEKLVFYTSYIVGEDDNTDLWKPVRDVDFIDLPPMSTDRADIGDVALSDTMLPAEHEHVPGYEPLTIGLIANAAPVHLTQGRVAKGPVAVLRNVTIARANPTPLSLATAPAPGPGLPAPASLLALGQRQTDLAAFARNWIDQASARLLDRLKSMPLTGESCSRIVADIFDPAKVDAACRPYLQDLDPTQAKNALLASVKPQLTGEVRKAAGRAKSLIIAARDRMNAACDDAQAGLLTFLSKPFVDFTAAREALTTAIERDRTLVRLRLDEFKAIVATLGQSVATFVSDLNQEVADLQASVPASVIVEIDTPPTPPGLGALIQNLTTDINTTLAGAAVGIQTLRSALANVAAQVATEQQGLNASLAEIDAALAKIKRIIDRDNLQITDIQNMLQQAVISDATTAIGNVRVTLVTPIAAVLSQWQSLIDTVDRLVEQWLVNGFEAIVNPIVDPSIDAVAPAFKGFRDFVGDAADAHAFVTRQIDDARATLDANVCQPGIAAFEDEVGNAIRNARVAIDARIGQTRQALRDAVDQGFRDATGIGLDDARHRATGVYQQGDAVLRTLRALGDPPKTDALGFNRPEVAYVLQEANGLGVNMTPAIALANRVADTAAAAQQAEKAVGDLLQSIGIRLPTSQLTDQLIPEKLKGLSVANLLPNVAGIDFKGLLKDVGFPNLEDAKAMRVQHGLDAQTLTAWLSVDIDVPFATATPLLSFGPVQIVIDQARFWAKSRMTRGKAGSTMTSEGSITGDWRVVCSGQTMLTFRDTALAFDKTGRIDFNIQPDRVELAEVLQFLTQLVQASGQQGDLVIGPLESGGKPVGLSATLDLALPDIQSGAFGISSLSLHLMFGIAAMPQFRIVSELSVGTRMAPFCLNVWILNGGGYFVQRLSFLPTARPRPLLLYSLDVAIVAGVGLGFSFGVVSGGVWLQVGCAITLNWRTDGGGNTTALTAFILARGNVDVAGLVTAGIALRLEITYDGRTMIGAGTLSISIKISMFFKLSVHEHVEYRFVGGEQRSAAANPADSYC